MSTTSAATRLERLRLDRLRLDRVSRSTIAASAMTSSTDSSAAGATFLAARLRGVGPAAPGGVGGLGLLGRLLAGRAFRRGLLGRRLDRMSRWPARRTPRPDRAPRSAAARRARRGARSAAHRLRRPADLPADWRPGAGGAGGGFSGVDWVWCVGLVFEHLDSSMARTRSCSFRAPARGPGCGSYGFRCMGSVLPRSSRAFVTLESPLVAVERSILRSSGPDARRARTTPSIPHVTRVSGQ